MIRRSRGQTLSLGTVALNFVPASVLFVIIVIIALASFGLRGVEALLAGVVVAVLTGIGVLLARQWGDAAKSAENRTLLMLAALAVAGLLLRIVGELAR